MLNPSVSRVCTGFERFGQNLGKSCSKPALAGTPLHGFCGDLASVLPRLCPGCGEAIGQTTQLGSSAVVRPGRQAVGKWSDQLWGRVPPYPPPRPIEDDILHCYPPHTEREQNPQLTAPLPLTPSLSYTRDNP